MTSLPPKPTHDFEDREFADAEVHTRLAHARWLKGSAES